MPSPFAIFLLTAICYLAAGLIGHFGYKTTNPTGSKFERHNNFS